MYGAVSRELVPSGSTTCHLTSLVVIFQIILMLLFQSIILISCQQIIHKIDPAQKVL